MSRQKGFTLIELLVAAAIMGTVTTALTGVTFSIFHNTDDNNGRVEAVTGIEIAAHQMTEDGMSAQQYCITDGTPEICLTDGTEITLSWMIYAEESMDGYSRGYDVWYHLSGSDLVRDCWIQVYDGSAIPPTSYTTKVLARNIEALTFNNEDNALTEAFKVTVTSSGGGTRINEVREYHVSLRPD